MRVLITNNSLAERAGTELYVRDIAHGLRRRGHEPIAYSSRLGPVGAELRAAGVPVIDDLRALDAPPDLIHAHHHLDAMAALLRFPRVPAILFCHGSTPWEEAPVSFPSVRRFVAIDQACHDRLTTAGVAPERIVTLPTFVDLARFPLRTQIAVRPRRALVFSNYAKPGPALDTLRAACLAAGLEGLDAVGFGVGASAEQPEALLARYDLVFAKGRAAHEAAATGAAVMVCDYQKLAGLLTPERYDAWRPLNFGLRTLVHPLDCGRLVEEIRRYCAQDVRAVAERLRREADLESTLTRLLALYHEVGEERLALAALPESVFAAAASNYMRSLAIEVKVRAGALHEAVDALAPHLARRAAWRRRPWVWLRRLLPRHLQH